MTIKTLADLTPQRENANKGTQRGRGMLERSVDRVGVLGALTVAADGETFDGSKRLEVFADAFGPDAEPIIVHSDGTRPVIHVRDDIPNASDPRAVEAGLLANRVAAVSLEWDADVLAAIAEAGAVDLSALWREDELANLLGQVVDPGDVWQGMPEFEQEDQLGERRIIVHLATDDDVQSFAAAVGQTITERTKYLWHPYRAPQDLKRWGYRSDDA